MSGSEADTTQTGSLMSPEREPLHFLGSIQPHGILLALSDSELKILQVSANTQAHLGIQSQNLLGQSLDTLLDAQLVEAIRQNCDDFDSINPLKLSIRTSTGERSFNGMVHRVESNIILELELTNPPNEASFSNVHTQLRRAIAKLRRVSSLSEFFQLATKEIRKIMGFDRVMVYQFDPKKAGAVIAEAKRDDLASAFPESPFLLL